MRLNETEIAKKIINGYGLGTDLQGEGYAFVKNTDNSILQTRGDISITDGNWHHLAMTYSPDGHLNLYVDGILDETQISPFYFNSDNSLRFTIGGIETGEEFNGKIDDVYIYNRAISDDDIAILAGLKSANVPDSGNGLILLAMGLIFIISINLRKQYFRSESLPEGAITGRLFC